MVTCRELVLASSSPRRRELLALLGIPFRWIAPREDESPPAGSSFPAQAETIARAKALDVAAGMTSGLIIAADTIVVFEGRCLGKPASAREAEDWLLAMRGREHEVITGLLALDAAPGRLVPSHTTTTVWMRSYSIEEARRYIDSGDPADKAGAYAIQNQVFHPVERIEGCYYNVVGLPLLALDEALSQLGFDTEARSSIPTGCQGCPTGSALI